MKLWNIYSREIPDFVRAVSGTSPMQRLKGIGMNCGCEYTGFSGFRSIGAYTRFDHSVGTSLIVWNFTRDIRQSISALLHDVSTPVFAHVIDFMHGDHVKQESTEARTLETIKSSSDLVTVLSGFGLAPEDVYDYHIFPIADNEIPKLSSDRLEYTLGNMVNFNFATEYTAARLYNDLTTGENETGEPEIMFIHKDIASEFAAISLRCSKVYSSDADRYAMQILAELMAEGMHKGLIIEDDLYSTEADVLKKIGKDEALWQQWLKFRSMSKIKIGGDSPQARIIQAKKRHIDPYVQGNGRVSAIDEKYRDELSGYLKTDFNYTISI